MARHFTSATYQFLKELAANNDKEWWELNKTRYQEKVREPALDFIVELAERVAEISPHFPADTRVNGGSLMRPYRDVRFSKDKTPYKTNVGIQLRHTAGGDVHAPGFYVHIEPGRNFAGVGLWTPETAVARRIRQAIDDQPNRWGEAAHDPSFTATWEIGGHDEDRLRRVPTGFHADHRYGDDLRLRSFIAGSTFPQAMATSATFADELAERFKKAGPFTRFLCDAIGLPF